MTSHLQAKILTLESPVMTLFIVAQRKAINTISSEKNNFYSELSFIKYVLSPLVHGITPNSMPTAFKQ